MVSRVSRVLAVVGTGQRTLGKLKLYHTILKFLMLLIKELRLLGAPLTAEELHVIVSSLQTSPTDASVGGAGLRGLRLLELVTSEGADCVEATEQLIEAAKLRSLSVHVRVS